MCVTIRRSHKVTPRRVTARGHDTEGVSSMCADSNASTNCTLPPRVRERYEALVVKAGPLLCWGWNGSVSNGYGTFRAAMGVTKFYAHRVSYELAYGPIPDRYDIDHLCRNPICSNPTHLEAVTHRENCLRGRMGRMRTHCPHGHEYTPENTYYRKGGTRLCRACMTARARADWQRELAARKRENPEEAA